MPVDNRRLEAVLRARQGHARGGRGSSSSGGASSSSTATASAIGIVDGDRESGAWPPPAATLLLGIHSWSNAEARQRRAGIRALAPASPAAAVRFIVNAKGSKPANDTVRFELGPPGIALIASDCF